LTRDENELPSAPSAEPAASAERPTLWSTRNLLSLGITLALLVALAWMIDWEAVWREFRRADKGLLLLGMLAHYATYLVRGARWRRSIRHLQSATGYLRFGMLVFFYNFIDNIVPAKLGDIYGAHLARINLGVRRSAALGSIVFQRMIDSWVVVALATIGATFVFSDQLPTSVIWALVFGGVVAVAASGLIVVFAVLKKIPKLRLPEVVESRLVAFQAGMWPRRRELVTIALMTIVIWGLETLWILALCRAFGLDLDLAQLLVVTMIPLLATAFPLTPSGAGVVELSLYGSLRAVGAEASLAASITVMNRLIDYWLHILLGIVTWAVRERLGLRTWREVPLSATEPEPSPEHQSRPEPGSVK
jgi:uncharacterized protein (TIRG00374 family)